jgi:subtilisin family serine protease
MQRPADFGLQFSLLSLVIVALICAPVSAAGLPGAHPRRSAATPPAGNASYAPGEVVIGWQPDARATQAHDRPRLSVDRSSPEWRQTAQRLTARTGLAVLDTEPEYGMARLAVPAGQEHAAIAQLLTLPWVKYAEPNYMAHAAGYPNDPHIGIQWNMRRVAAPEAWDLTFGSYSLVVAVIDSGVDLYHPEFTGRLRPGYDYVNGDDLPYDDYGHGTHVTGILAAAANNGIGVAGLAAAIRILPLKVLDAQGSGYYYNIALAIRRAADSGAQIINLSLGGFSDSLDLQEAVSYALGRNCFVAAAAGNCADGGAGCAGRNPNYYPAAYAGVVAVGATDHFDNWATYSGYKSYLALSAPGGVGSDPIWSTLPGSGYGSKYGTSMATPLVSAAAALILTYMPTATPAQIADILKNTADKVGPYTYVGGRNDWYGAGRLNVARAVRWAYPPALKPTTDRPRFLLGAPVTQQRLALALNNESAQPATWQATVLEGAAWLSVTPSDGVSAYSAPGKLTLQAGPTALGPGEYDGVIEIKTLAPVVTTFRIYVTLRVAASLQQQFVPLTVSQDRAADWVDPTLGGAPIYPTDSAPALVSLPFPVAFYGSTYQAMWVSFKGYTSFTQPGTEFAASQSACLPTGTAPNDAIYILWQNWSPALGGQVYIEQPDTDRFAVTWYQVRRWEGDLRHSFQVIFLRSGEMSLKYHTVQSPTLGTVGAEYWDGTVAQQIACAGAGRLPVDGDAFPLTAILPW